MNTTIENEPCNTCGDTEWRISVVVGGKRECYRCLAKEMPSQSKKEIELDARKGKK